MINDSEVVRVHNIRASVSHVLRHIASASFYLIYTRRVDCILAFACSKRDFVDELLLELSCNVIRVHNVTFH